ncbi:MAG: SMC-Scp complex subunit ScpB [bacterium]
MYSQIETILFIAGKPVAIKKIAGILVCEEEKAREEIKNLQQEYKKQNKGFRILFDNCEAELVSSPENEEIASKFFKSEIQEDLSRAALETLAVVAYKCPISRLEIEEIRGVNCQYTLRSLLMRGLINKFVKTGITYYQITLELCKKFGIEKAEDLIENVKWSIS